MDKKLEQDLINRLVPCLHDMRRQMEAEWATCFWVDDKVSVITVYGKRPGHALDKLIQLCRLPVASFNRYMSQNKTTKLECLERDPLAAIITDPPKDQNTSVSPPAPLPAPSHAVDEVGPPTSPSGSLAKKLAAFRTASQAASVASASSATAASPKP